MTGDTTTETTDFRLEAPEWNPPEPPDDLIFDDGEPLETYRHRLAMDVLIDSAEIALNELAGRTDFFVGGNMFVYYSRNQAMNRDFRGPDFFAVLNVEGRRERKGWVVWEEEGRYPDVIIELLSRSTASIDLGIKKELYERTFRTAEYFVFNPFDPTSLQGWRLDASQQYQPLVRSDRGWLWCETLGLWLGTWEGRIRRNSPTEIGTWLRFYTSDGDVVPLPDERAEQERQRAERERQQAEQERQRAEQASQQAEQERQRAEQASQQAEQERQRAEQASQQAEQERQRAEQERQRAERLADQLRALGIDPAADDPAAME